ncbi:Chorismate--pyruvate lyase [uncultured Candidatus Thioglobus sp.]|nr:Chorismate--pyruvate lyase [uncultured Candidatus Thioglobus sp.]
MNTENLVWNTLNAQTVLPDAQKSWLADEQSLTHKLKQMFDDFSVNLLSQTQSLPYENESKLIAVSGECVIREVELLGNQQAVVFARSIIPMTNDTKDLLSIGSKPLGEVLFNNADIKRGAMQITRAGDIWGRRSTFEIGSTKVLVCEFFLEALYA